MTTQIDVLNEQIAQLNAQKTLNTANANFNNVKLSKQITDIEAQKAVLQTPPADSEE